MATPSRWLSAPSSSPPEESDPPWHRMAGCFRWLQHPDKCRSARSRWIRVLKVCDWGPGSTVLLWVTWIKTGWKFCDFSVHVIANALLYAWTLNKLDISSHVNFFIVTTLCVQLACVQGIRMFHGIQHTENVRDLTLLCAMLLAIYYRCTFICMHYHECVNSLGQFL
jgi:hypothetical protein